MKFKVRDHLLSKWLQELPTTEDVRSAVRRVFSSFEQVRSCWAPYDEKTPVDLTWCTGWPQHGQLLIQLLDDLLFGSTFDGRYKDSFFEVRQVQTDPFDTAGQPTGWAVTARGPAQPGHFKFG